MPNGASSSSTTCTASPEPARTRAKPRGGRQTRGRGPQGVHNTNGSVGCTSGGPAMCVGEAGRAMTELVREAAGLKKQRKKSKGAKSSKSGGSAFPESPSKSEGLGSPRSSSSSSGGSDRGNTFTQSLRDLFSAGAYREPAGSRRNSRQDLAAGLEGRPWFASEANEGEAGHLNDEGRPFRFGGAKLHESWGEYDYDEDLQEDLFMERVFFPIPVQNTFIHYNMAEEDVTSPKWLSSPAQVLTKSFHTIWPAHEEAHYQNRCRPCAYHLYKTDGCRLGNDCMFCHLCKRGEIKKRKKEKARAMRVAREARQMAAASRVDESGCSPKANGSECHSHDEDSPDSGNESPMSAAIEARNKGA